MEELRGTGVKVTVLCPPPVRTSFSNAARIASASYLSTTETTPAEVARYGYRMMKRGKPVAVYGSRYKFLSRPNHAALCFAQIGAPFERAGFAIAIIAMAASVGRHKDLARIEQLLEQAKIDSPLYSDVEKFKEIKSANIV